MEEKLSYEYELFVLDCLRQSKAGIYARSEEIEIKKKVVPLIKKWAGNAPELKEKLLLLDNILEEAYRYVKDYQEQESRLETLVCRWLDLYGSRVKTGTKGRSSDAAPKGKTQEKRAAVKSDLDFSGYSNVLPDMAEIGVQGT